MSNTIKFYVIGLVYAAMWSSASVAAKFGLRSVQPLMLYALRFSLAAFCILMVVYLLSKSRLPKGKEWLDLAIFGLLNNTVALGFFALGIKEVAAGVGSLQVGVNPLVISVISALVARRRILLNEILALVIGIAGMGIVVWPLMAESYATPLGLFYLALSTLSYSGAAVFFSERTWELPRLTINGWQSFFGALFLLPFAFLLNDHTNEFDINFYGALVWLAIPLSVGCVMLWMWLLSRDAVKASLFLFLCPGFGLVYAFLILDEPMTVYTIGGLLTVMVGVYIGQKKKGESLLK